MEEVHALWELRGEVSALPAEDRERVVAEASGECAEQLRRFVENLGTFIQMRDGKSPTFQVHATPDGRRAVAASIAPKMREVLLGYYASKEALANSLGSP
jgi:hypothetical protein